MAYLSLEPSVFLGNYDSLVEQCFEYVFENEDECLFEEVLLNELSHSLKMRAAMKAATSVDQDERDLYLWKKYENDYNSDPNKDDPEEKVLIKDTIGVLSKALDKNLNKRKRIYKYAASVDPGTEYEDHFFDNNSKDPAHQTTLSKKTFEYLSKQDTSKPGVKEKINRVIQSLQKKYNKLKSDIQNTPPEKRTLLQKFMHKIIQMIDKFKGLLNK